MLRRLLPVALLALLCGCPANGENGPGQPAAGGAHIMDDSLPELVDVPFERVYQHGDSDFGQAFSGFVTTSPEWREVWTRAIAAPSGAGSAPDVDFGSEMVLVVAMEEQSSDCCSVRIERVGTANDSLYVVVQEGGVGAGCSVSAVMTQPVDIVKTRRSDLPIRFVRRYRYESCE